MEERWHRVILMGYPHDLYKAYVFNEKYEELAVDLKYEPPLELYNGLYSSGRKEYDTLAKQGTTMPNFKVINLLYEHLRDKNSPLNNDAIRLVLSYI